MQCRRYAPIELVESQIDALAVFADVSQAAVHDAHWLFFDLGNTLVSEEAATVRRIHRLVDALARYGRRHSVDEVRSAFEEA